MPSINDWKPPEGTMLVLREDFEELARFKHDVTPLLQAYVTAALGGNFPLGRIVELEPLIKGFLGPQDADRSGAG